MYRLIILFLLFLGLFSLVSAQDQKVKYYQSGNYQIAESIYFCKNLNGIVEEITLIMSCLADCTPEKVFYKNSKLKTKILLKIVDWDFGGKKIKVKFPNDMKVYFLEIFMYGVELKCYNPDGSIQKFRTK